MKSKTVDPANPVLRPYTEIDLSTDEALNNADTYAFFVCDLTAVREGSQRLHKKRSLPEWWKMDIVKPLYEEVNIYLIDLTNDKNNLSFKMISRLIGNTRDLCLMKKGDSINLIYQKSDDKIGIYLLTQLDIAMLPTTLQYESDLIKHNHAYWFDEIIKIALEHDGNKKYKPQYQKSSTDTQSLKIR